MHSVDGLLLSSMCHLATPPCDLDQPGWICHLIPFVETQWLSGRMPDSRSRGHRHESSTHIGAVDDDRLFIYSTVAPLKLLNDFHRRLIYLCQDIWLPTWYCWYDHIDEKYGTICSNECKSQMPSLLTLMNSNRTPTTCMYCHQKWQCGILPLFFSKKLTYVLEMFPLLRVWQAHHSQLLYQSGEDSRDAAWDHRHVLEDSSLGIGKSKCTFYIAQRFTLFALHVHSDINSASPWSILTMEQLLVTTKSLTFPPLSISCCRNSCHIADQDCQKRSQCVSKTHLRSVGDIALNQSLHTNNVNKVTMFYCIVLILRASCSFWCTLSLYWQCDYLYSAIVDKNELNKAKDWQTNKLTK